MSPLGGHALPRRAPPLLCLVLSSLLLSAAPRASAAAPLVRQVAVGSPTADPVISLQDTLPAPSAPPEPSPIVAALPPGYIPGVAYPLPSVGGVDIDAEALASIPPAFVEGVIPSPAVVEPTAEPVRSPSLGVSGVGPPRQPAVPSPPAPAAAAGRSPRPAPSASTNARVGAAVGALVLIAVLAAVAGCVLGLARSTAPQGGGDAGVATAVAGRNPAPPGAVTSPRGVYSVYVDAEPPGEPEHGALAAARRMSATGRGLPAQPERRPASTLLSLAPRPAP